jgi:hypothetical protein
VLGGYEQDGAGPGAGAQWYPPTVRVEHHDIGMTARVRAIRAAKTGVRALCGRQLRVTLTGMGVVQDREVVVVRDGRELVIREVDVAIWVASPVERLKAGVDQSDEGAKFYSTEKLHRDGYRRDRENDPRAADRQLSQRLQAAFGALEFPGCPGSTAEKVKLLQLQGMLGACDRRDGDELPEEEEPIVTDEAADATPLPPEPPAQLTPTGW